MEILALLIIVGLVVSALLKLQASKGALGERVVQILTSLRLDSAVYHRIDDITLESSWGTTQIDHVFVSVYGVFVVETKNMRAGFLVVSTKPCGLSRYSRNRANFRTRYARTLSM